MELTFKTILRLNWIDAISNAPRGLKKLFQIIFDLLVLSIAYILAVWLVIDSDIVKPDPVLGWLFISISISALYFARVYRVVVRYSGFRLVTLITNAQLTAVSVWALVCFLSNNSTTSKVLVALLLISIFLIGGGRLVARKILDDAFVNGEKVLIYGVGEVAVRTMASLRREVGYSVLSFVDDGGALSGFELHGVPVISSAHLEEKILAEGVSTVIIANQDSLDAKNKSLLNQLESLPVVVNRAPAATEFLQDDRGGINELR